MLTDEEANWYESLFKQSTLTSSNQVRLGHMVLDHKLSHNDINLLEARFPGHFALTKREWRILRLKCATVFAVVGVALVAITGLRLWP